MGGTALSPGDASAPPATWAAAHSQVAEDWLGSSGADRYVVLRAGLDSFVWRRQGVRVFDVDHPVTQAWKRSRLETLGLREPAELVWVPVDFDVESVGAALDRAGLGSGPTFMSWLGVAASVSLYAISATLRSLPPCSLAVSYATSPDEFAEVLAAGGFSLIEDIGPADVERRYGLSVLSTGNERIALARKPPNSDRQAENAPQDKRTQFLAVMDAINSCDFEAAAQLVDPEVELHSTISLSGEVYVGVDGLRRWAEDLSETWVDFRIEVIDFREAGDDRAAVVTSNTGTARQSGVPLDALRGMAVTWRNGKPWRGTVYPETGDAFRAVGLRRD